MEQRPGAGGAAGAGPDPDAFDPVLEHELEVRTDKPVQVDIDRIAIEAADRDVLVVVAEAPVEQERLAKRPRGHDVADQFVGRTRAAGDLLMDELELAL